MKSTLILLLVVLFSAGNAVALDIRGVPLCEDSVEPRIPSGLVGEFRKLKSSFILTREGVEEVPDIIKYTAGQPVRLREELFERNYCKKIGIKSNGSQHELEVKLIDADFSASGYDRKVHVFKLSHNSKTNITHGGFDSGHFGLFLYFIPGGGPTRVRMLIYRKQ